jgi:endonuclease YncB( thermonuclease family)
VRLGRRARSRHLGLWGRCPGTPWDPNHGVSTGPP